MQNKLIIFCLITFLGFNKKSSGQWTYSTVDAQAIGCPGIICVNGPSAGYTFEVTPFSFSQPIIPGVCGNIDISVPAGVFTLTVKQTSSGNILQTCNNIVINQPAACGLYLYLNSLSYGCYNDNSISVWTSGYFCGGGYVQIYKENNYLYQVSYNGPTLLYFNNLTPGNYTIQATDFGNCTDTLMVSIQENCVSPDSGLNTTNITKTSAKLNWITPPCAQGYSVQYRVKNSSTWITKTLGINQGFKYISGLNAGTIYQWRVRAKCNLQPISKSSWSSVKTFTTLLPRDEFELNEISGTVNVNLFPNPASETVNITSNVMFSKNVKLTLTDINGRIFHLSYTTSSDNEIEADISTVANGIYQLKITDSSRLLVMKLAVLK